MPLRAESRQLDSVALSAASDVAQQIIEQRTSQESPTAISFEHFLAQPMRFSTAACWPWWRLVREIRPRTFCRQLQYSATPRRIFVCASRQLDNTIGGLAAIDQFDYAGTSS